jgi:hypothetical protein
MVQPVYSIAGNPHLIQIVTYVPGIPEFPE